MPAQLPRGRHGLDHDFVADHQRERVLAAAVVAVSNRSLSDVTVEDLVRLSRVSRKTLYELFPDGKKDVFVAVLRTAATQISERATLAASQGVDLADQVRGGVESILAHAAASPVESRMVWVDAPLVGPPGLDARAESMAWLELLTAAHADTAPCPVPGGISRLLGAGLIDLIADHVVRDALPELHQRLPDALFLCLVAFLGPVAALQECRRAPAGEP
jgi:AcrR family transcriptional regulator